MKFTPVFSSLICFCLFSFLFVLMPSMIFTPSSQFNQYNKIWVNNNEVKSKEKDKLLFAKLLLIIIFIFLWFIFYFGYYYLINMYFISENSTFNEEFQCFGSLIGIHENYLYAANSFENVLQIYRRKLMETRGWELFWSFEITSYSYCSCSDSVSGAFGIVGNELFVASHGLIPNDSEIRLHLVSINLSSFEIIDYKTDSTNISDFAFSLCNQCCLSSITALNPLNPNEISIIPWTPEPSTRFSTTLGTFTDCIQSKFILDPSTKTCMYLQSSGFKICGNQNPSNMNQSNIGTLGFGKVLYFKDNELILGQSSPSETVLQIVGDSDLQNCLYAGFCNTENGLVCIGFEKSPEFRNQQICRIFAVEIDEENSLAKFTKAVTLPHHLVPSDPRFSKFVMDSRMLIWSYQNQTFTYIFGGVSLSEASYISASNFSSPLFQEYQRLSEIKEFKFGDRSGIFDESESFGLSQNEIKEVLGLPKTFEFCMN